MSSILLIEPDQTTRGILTDVLRTEGYNLTATPGIGNATEQIVCEDYSMVIADISSIYDEGLEFVKTVNTEANNVAVVLITDVSQDIDAVGDGNVYAHVTKPLKMVELLSLVQGAIDYGKQAVEDLESVRIEVETDYPFKDLVAESDAMRGVCDMISRIAATHVPVLVVGEPGTGKSLVGRTIHDNSPRKDKAYMGVDCSVEPVAKLEAALFGKGAKPGLLEVARGGTTLMMDVHCLPLQIQEALVAAFRDKAFRRIGSKEKIDLDVRAMATSPRKLEHEVQAGTFSAELSKLLNALTILLPPLREHREDIGPLIARALRREVGDGVPLPTIESGAETVLQNFPWPGNVEQLENTVRSAARATKDGRITMESIKPYLAVTAS